MVRMTGLGRGRAWVLVRVVIVFLMAERGWPGIVPVLRCPLMLQQILSTVIQTVVYAGKRVRPADTYDMHRVDSLISRSRHPASTSRNRRVTDELPLPG